MRKQRNHNCRKITARIQKYFWNKQVIKSEWATATEEILVGLNAARLVAGKQKHLV